LADYQGAIFAGDECGGVYLSMDNGASWTSVSSGLSYYLCMTLAVYDGYLFAGTNFAGVWRRPLSEMIGTAAAQSSRRLETPADLAIRSPGPSDPYVTLTFFLPHPDHVTTIIYNVFGKVITSFVNRDLTSGTHTLRWNAQNLAAGCYVLKMQAGSKSCVKSFPVLWQFFN
jgi:hypothetical protein